MNRGEYVLGICVALTPARLRHVREEQWRADLRDGPELGISRSSLLLAALRSSATSRFTEVVHRADILLSYSLRGKNMKLILGIAGSTVAVVAATAIGLHASSEDHSYRPQDSMALGGYEGWWNGTPVKGSSAGLPKETVAVNTTSNQIVDAFNRARNDAGQATLISDVDFDVVPDPSWPKNSVVIIETSSKKVIESFPVDEKGWPIYSEGSNPQ